MDQMAEYLEALKAQMRKATNTANRANIACREAETAYALAKAESVGVKIGSIVTTGRRRYRVKSILFYEYSKYEFKLFGKKIRKDGSEGVDTLDLWYWTLEPTEEEQA
jgi:hypothetical protein